MSFENFPSGSTPPEQKTVVVKQKDSKTDSKNIIIIVLAVILLATIGYLIWDKTSDREKEQAMNTQLTSADSSKNELQKELNDASTQIDALKSENAKADSLVTSKDKDIQDIKNRIQTILQDKNATASKLSEARRLINTLKTNIASYKAEIDRLQGENAKLTDENKKVTGEKEVIAKNYDSAQNLIKEKENIIDVGSTLHASNFNIEGIKERKNGKEKEVTSAKRVDLLRITFDLDENRITTTGMKDIYICITGPDGKPVAVPAMGSGSFTTRDGIERPFSKKVPVNYVQGQKQTITVDWKQNSEFLTGDYKIEVYNNGFKIGEGTRAFKKGGLFG